MPQMNFLHSKYVRILCSLALALGVAGAQAADPAPKEVKEKRKGTPSRVDDLMVAPLSLEAKELIGSMVWGDNEGKTFFTLDNNGMVRKITFPEMFEVLQMDLGRKCSCLSMSAEGLIVTASGSGEIWVLDSDNLSPKRKIGIAGVRRAVSSPAQSFAIASTQDALYVVDLKRNTRPVRHSPPSGSTIRVGFESPVVTPDGLRVFTTDGGKLFRFVFTLAGHLKGEFATHDLGSSGKVEMSPDGKFVCLTTHGGNTRGLKLHPQTKDYALYVYPVKDLTKPAFTIEHNNWVPMVAFDPAAELVYARSGTKELCVFTYTGVKKKEYDLGRRGEHMRQYLVHPEGRKLVMLTDQKISMVELPAEK